MAEKAENSILRGFDLDKIEATARKSLDDWENYDYDAECKESVAKQRAWYLEHSGDADDEDFFPRLPLRSSGPTMTAYHPEIMLQIVELARRGQ